MHNTCVKKIFTGVKAIFQVFTVCLCVFVLVRYSCIIKRQHDIQDRILVLEEILQEDGALTNHLSAVDISSYNLADQVSASLGIISAGICVFALFGGILSVFNIVRSKELEQMASQMKNLLENQHELEGARLLQDGIVHASRGRIQYAINCFDKVILQVPDTAAALTARYERLSIYADNFTEEGTLSEIEKIFNDLQAAIDKSNKPFQICQQIMGDACFTLGCTYGKCAMFHSPMNKDYICKAKLYLKKAIRCNNDDIDYHKNLAYTYSLINDIDKCKKQLDRAIAYAEQEPLYKRLVSNERLEKLFKPAWDILSTEMREMLSGYISTKYDHVPLNEQNQKFPKRQRIKATKHQKR